MWLLSNDLTEKIFLGLTVRDSARCRRVCKGWCNLLRNKRFVRRQIDSCKTPLFLGFDGGIKVVDLISNLATPSHIASFTAAIPDLIVICDGLVLSSNFSMKRENSLYISNPLLETTSQVFSPPRKPYSREDWFGIGYSRRSRLKILRFRDDINEQQRLQIFNVSSHAWRTIPAWVTVDWRVQNVCQGLSVGGNMVWIAKWKAAARGTYFLQTFDFGTLTFTQRDLPAALLEHDIINTSSTTSLSVYNVEGLSLLHQPQGQRDMNLFLKNTLLGNWEPPIVITSLIPRLLPILRLEHLLPQPVHYINQEGAIVVMCQDNQRDYDEDEFDPYEDEFDPYEDEFDLDAPEEEEDGEADKLMLLTIERNGDFQDHGFQHAIFWLPNCCGYVYVPSPIPVPELY